MGYGLVADIKVSPKKELRVKDLNNGQSGWTTEWSIVNGHIDDDYILSKHKGGTASVRVTCVGVDEYMIEYETPVYCNIWNGKYSEAQDD